MDRSDAARDRHPSDGRGALEKFVEAVNQVVSRAPFFAVIVADLMASRANDEPDHGDAVRRLRGATGLEERH